MVVRLFSRVPVDFSSSRIQPIVVSLGGLLFFQWARCYHFSSIRGKNWISEVCCFKLVFSCPRESWQTKPSSPTLNHLKLQCKSLAIIISTAERELHKLGTTFFVWSFGGHRTELRLHMNMLSRSDTSRCARRQIEIRVCVGRGKLKLG